jgi:hypothetical protein
MMIWDLGLKEEKRRNCFCFLDLDLRFGNCVYRFVILFVDFMMMLPHFFLLKTIVDSLVLLMQEERNFFLKFIFNILICK